MKQIQASNQAFAAILGNGSVVTWGWSGKSDEQEHLSNVHSIQASEEVLLGRCFGTLCWFWLQGCVVAYAAQFKEW